MVRLANEAVTALKTECYMLPGRTSPASSVCLFLKEASLTAAKPSGSVCSEHLQCALARPENTALAYGPSSKCGAHPPKKAPPSGHAGQDTHVLPSSNPTPPHPVTPVGLCPGIPEEPLDETAPPGPQISLKAPSPIPVEMSLSV